MSVEDDYVRWQRAATRTRALRPSKTDAFFADVNALLDELNSLYFGSPVIGRHEDAWPVLSKFAAVVPSNGTNDHLATKFCQLVINLLSKQKVIINQDITDDLLEFLTKSIQSSQKWVLPDHLKALGAVLYENAPMCSKYLEMLLAEPPTGLLAGLICDPGWDMETRCNAVSCIANTCLKSSTGQTIGSDHVTRAFEIILNTIKFKPQQAIEDVDHYRLLLNGLRALQVILVLMPSVDASYQQSLLSALKNCMLCGLPGYKPCFLERSNIATSSELQADDLSSVNLPVFPPKSRSYQNSGTVKKKKKRNAQRKDKGYSNKTPSYNSSPNLRFPVDHSSTDALMPAFAKASLSNSDSPILTQGDTLRNGAKHDRPHVTGAGDLVHSGSSSFGESASVVGLGSSIGQDTGSDARVSTSSDSEYSDSEAGQLLRLRSMMSKVRQTALGCLQAVVKGMNKKVMFGYWSSFIPDTTTSGCSWSLFSIILRDPSPRARSGGVGVLTELLDGSRQFLAAAEDREELSPARPYTSFSIKLASTIHELHRCLLQALIAETSLPAKLHLLKCLSVLVLNSPYNRLKTGLLTRVVHQVKPLINNKDSSLCIAALTCLGMVVSVNAPLAEVREITRPPQVSTATDPTQMQEAKRGSQEERTGNSSRTSRESEALNASEGKETSWLLTACVKAVAKQPRDIQPMQVRIEAIQVLTAFVRNYFEHASSHVQLLSKIASSYLSIDEQTISMFAIKLLEELSKTMNVYLSGEKKSSEVSVTQEELLGFWMELLEGPFLGLMQSGNPKGAKLTSTAIDCLSNIGPIVFEILPEDKRITCITMLLGLANEDDNYIKASAVRAVGVLVLYPCLRDDVLFVADTANAVLTCMEDRNIAVRMRAAWSLGNLTDALVVNRFSGNSSFVEDFSDMLLLKLLDLAISASSDHEKVKSNAVRALGNILRYLTSAMLAKRGFSLSLERAIQALANNVCSGLMKVRWNACYAVGNVFRNAILPLGSAKWTGTIFSALESVIRDCKNFKVRINAVLSLSIPKERHCYGDVNQFVSIIATLSSALEATNTLTDFSEFKYRDTLRQQLCNTLCHLISLVAVEDLPHLSPVLDPCKDSLRGFLSDYSTHLTSQTPEEQPDHLDVSMEENQGKQSLDDRAQILQQARVHVCEELGISLPSVKILREVLEPIMRQETRSAPMTSD